jgi:ABC-2 type transport system permease protein
MTTRPESPRGVRAFAAETFALYARSLKKLSRRPVALYFSLFQPMIWLLLFGQIFNRLAELPGAAAAFGGKSYFQFFIPAVILQTILAGSGQSGLGILSDIESGFLDKLLTAPIARMAILLGRIFADLTRLLVQAALILGIAYAAGRLQARPVVYEYGLLGVFGALGIALLFGAALSGLSVFIALKTRNTESTFLISNFLTMPLLFLSSAQLPLSLLPAWLQTAARFNPVTYAISAMRILLNGAGGVTAGPAGVEVLEALLVIAAIGAVTLTLAVRGFRRSVR